MQKLRKASPSVAESSLLEFPIAKVRYRCPDDEDLASRRWPLRWTILFTLGVSSLLWAAILALIF